MAAVQRLVMEEVKDIAITTQLRVRQSISHSLTATTSEHLSRNVLTDVVAINDLIQLQKLIQIFRFYIPHQKIRDILQHRDTRRLGMIACTHDLALGTPDQLQSFERGLH